ncbi:MAG: hypothetical protein ACK4IX_14195 [Candidatus Sericytochromatia bacterium]
MKEIYPNESLIYIDIPLNLVIKPFLVYLIIDAIFLITKNIKTKPSEKSINVLHNLVFISLSNIILSSLSSCQAN